MKYNVYINGRKSFVAEAPSESVVDSHVRRMLCDGDTYCIMISGNPDAEASRIWDE